MDQLNKKIWQIDDQRDFLKLTFRGKYAEGLNMLTFVLWVMGIILIGCTVILVIMMPVWVLLVMLLILLLVIYYFLWLNMQTRREVQEIVVTRDLVVLKIFRGKKVQVIELKMDANSEIKMNSPTKNNDTGDIILLLISPIIWFLVGASKRDPAPAFYNEKGFTRFFEFGSETEKTWIILYLKKYFSKPASSAD